MNESSSECSVLWVVDSYFISVHYLCISTFFVESTTTAAPGNQSTVLSALFRLNAKPLHSMTNQHLTVPKSCGNQHQLNRAQYGFVRDFELWKLRNAHDSLLEC